MSKSFGRVIGGDYASQEDYDRYAIDFIRDYQLNQYATQPYNNAMQYAQNNNTNIATDAQYVNNPNYISDEDLYARMRNNIKEFEKIIPYPYIDTKGTITIGPGKNVNTLEEFKSVNSKIVDTDASDDEKEKYFYKLRDMSMMIDANHNFMYHNTPAEDFKQYTPLRISDEESFRLAQNHMTNDLAHVRHEFTDFDSFPLPLKEILLDIQYNTGNLKEQSWPHLYKAIRHKDVFGDDGIVNNVSRKGIHEDRRKWTDRKARSIRF